MPLSEDIPEDFHIQFAAWTRIEPRCRSNDFSRGIQARTADPLWMLGRQWQTGEFQGEDAGSPIEIRLDHSIQTLDRIGLGDNGAASDITNIPLEAIVEQEKFDINWRTRVQMGQQFERFARDVLGGNAQAVINDYRIRFPLVPPGSDSEEWLNLDRRTRRYIMFMAGRVIDGTKLPSGDDQISEVFDKYNVWLEKRHLQPDKSKSDAWRNQQLDYRFKLSPPEEPATVKTCLKAPEYRNGELDWYSFNTLHIFSADVNMISSSVITALDSEVLTALHRELFEDKGINLSDHAVIRMGTQGELWDIIDGQHEYRIIKDNQRLYVYSSSWQPQETIIRYPTRISIAGNSPRWWAFEDAKIDFGNLDTAKPDLGKLLLMEFALIYGDDWFSIPVPVQLGEMSSSGTDDEAPVAYPKFVRIDRLKVSNVFGEEVDVGSARNQAEEPLQRWEMFTLSPDRSPRSASISDGIFIPAVTGFREESPPIEEVRFLRDEGANMVWGVEHLVPNGLGRPTNGFDAQRERAERRTEAEIQRLEAGNLTPDECEALEVDPEWVQKQIELLRNGPKISGDAISRYRLATTVPENWIPFVPTNAKAFLDLDFKSIRLRRAQMLRNTDAEDPESIQAMSRILEIAEDPLLWLEEATVPRSGLRAQLTAQRVRWMDGKTYVWLGRTVTNGRGEGSSGLKFDVLVNR